jgi:hypothetical protein
MGSGGPRPDASVGALRLVAVAAVLVRDVNLGDNARRSDPDD